MWANKEQPGKSRRRWPERVQDREGERIKVKRKGAIFDGSWNAVIKLPGLKMLMVPVKNTAGRLFAGKNTEPGVGLDTNAS